MNVDVGAFEAKTKLPELLREVQKGKRFTITLRGKPVAELGPPPATARPDPSVAIEAFQVFRQMNPIRRGIDIKALIEEGRQ